MEARAFQEYDRRDHPQAEQKLFHGAILRLRVVFLPNRRYLTWHGRPYVKTYQESNICHLATATRSLSQVSDRSDLFRGIRRETKPSSTDRRLQHDPSPIA